MFLGAPSFTKDGQAALGSRIVYTVVALAGIWCVSLLFRARERFEALDE